jgi:hypothetical protein
VLWITGITGILLILLLAPDINEWAAMRNIDAESYDFLSRFFIAYVPPLVVLLSLGWAGVLVWRGWDKMTTNSKLTRAMDRFMRWIPFKERGG